MELIVRSPTQGARGLKAVTRFKLCAPLIKRKGNAPIPRVSVSKLSGLLLLTAGFTLYPGTHSAHAEFRVCNQTLSLFNVAIGAETNGVFSTEGWWTLPANSCVSPIKEDLLSLRLKYVYLFATSIAGEDVLQGEWDMCIRPQKFKYSKLPSADWDCWIKGYQQAKFVEVDTGKAKSWTVFIQERQSGQGPTTNE